VSERASERVAHHGNEEGAPLAAVLGVAVRAAAEERRHEALLAGGGEGLLHGGHIVAEGE
jgi:hypothetical protein